ncbi:MAG: adenosylcobinamide-GDP ribazoletransferase [Oscillospiraceae bacterium]|jgi:adenosylcobinamide-GDP ribazoletransferase|nr:adenosylcobinamide-GDP ribazoletransferase [Oscillospiraceae bacterium]
MKNFFKSIIAAFSMFSRIPMPRIEWDEDVMRHMMTAFPLVGAVIGGIMLAFLRLADFFELHDALRALGMTLLPLAVTGGIHLDGLCDTCDALGAVVSPERRREILKDPRAGAFGVISVATYLLAYFALALAFDGSTSSTALYCFSFVMSRLFSANAVTRLKPAPDGTGRAFHDAAGKKGRLGLFTVLLFAVLALFVIIISVSETNSAPSVWMFALLVCYISLKRTVEKKFEGMSGDLAGWFLQRCELWQLGALVIVSALAR